MPQRRPAPEPAMLEDITIRLRQNIGIVTAVLLFCVLYVLYNLAHPRGFSSAVLVQNSDEIFALAMLAMAQTVPVLAAGLDLSVGAVMTMVGCIASYLLSGAATPIELTLWGNHQALAVLPGGIPGIVIGALICLVAGTLAGFFNGCVVVYGRIQP